MNYNDITNYNIYDIEVLKNYLLIECLHPDDSWTELENPTFRQLAEFLTIDNLTGFHSHSYDDMLLSGLYWYHVQMETPLDDPVDLDYAFMINDCINNGTPLKSFNELPYHKTRLPSRSFDVEKYTKSDPDYSTLGSLKAFENADMMDIEETPIPFHLEPNDIQKGLLRKYCRHDVRATKQYLQKMIDRGTVQSLEDLREMVAEELDIPLERLWYSGANSMVIKLFEPELGGANPQKYQRSVFFDYMENIMRLPHMDDPRVQAIYQYLIKYADEKDSLDLVEPEWVVDGFVFGLGGGHYQNPDTLVIENTYHSDYSSLYPSIAININALGGATEKFKKIVKKRLHAKHTGDKKTNKTYKIIINAIYGLMRSIQSGAYLYNKYAGLDICIAGQMLLYAMTKGFEDMGAIVSQSNTDGIIYKLMNGLTEEDILLYCDSYEILSNIGIETDKFDKVISKDVNNYFVLSNDNSLIEAKGALFNKKVFGNNQIVGEVIIDYFKGSIKSWKQYMKDSATYFICRAKCNRTFEFLTAEETAFPRYSEKTGKLLKLPELVYSDIEYTGRQLRGYPTKDGRVTRKLNKKTGKIGAIANVSNRLSTEQPSLEKLDTEYFYDLIFDNLNKIIPVTTEIKNNIKMKLETN